MGRTEKRILISAGICTLVFVIGAVLIIRAPGPTTPGAPIRGAPVITALDVGPVPDASATALDDEVEVEDVELGDGSPDWNQRSIRVLHADPRMRERLREWLLPREKEAVARNASLGCHADTATALLVSITCVSLSKWEPDPNAPPGQGGGSPNPEYASLTLRFTADGLEALSLKDVLRPGVGEKQVMEACEKASPSSSACAWPPTSFSIVKGDALFMCNDASCVTIEPEAGLIRPGLAGAP